MTNLFMQMLKPSLSYDASAKICIVMSKKIQTLPHFVARKCFAMTRREYFSIPFTKRCGSFTIIALLIPLSACQTASVVQPWEKGNLAKPEMTFEMDKQDTEFVEHTYSSKEGSSGGGGVGGGGCGCN